MEDCLHLEPDLQAVIDDLLIGVAPNTVDTFSTCSSPHYEAQR